MTFPNRSGPVSPAVGNMIPRAWESCSQAAGNVEDMSWRTGYAWKTIVRLALLWTGRPFCSAGFHFGMLLVRRTACSL